MKKNREKTPYKYRLKAKMCEYVRQEDLTILTLTLCPKNMNIKTRALSKTTKNARTGCRMRVRAIQQGETGYQFLF
jgi:hypothetical protein